MYDYVERRDRNGRSTRQPDGSRSDAIVRVVGWRRIGSWLTKGASDIVACRGRSLLFGLCYTGMGHATLDAYEREWTWVPAFAAAFLFLGPLLAVGLYELSRQREREEPTELVVALFAWCRNPRGLFLHAALLGAVLTAWLQISWMLLNRSADAGSSAVAGVALLPSAFWWIAWAALPVAAFVASVVAVPMLLDRACGVTCAIRTSVACCVVNEKTMSAWALVVVVSIGASLWLDFWPLVFTGPWIGHATWHAYRDCIGGSPVPTHAATPDHGNLGR